MATKKTPLSPPKPSKPLAPKTAKAAKPTTVAAAKKAAPATKPAAAAKRAAPATKPTPAAGKATAEASSPLVVGKAAPAFRLEDETGKVVSLADYKGKTLVLYFYPKDDTPGCTREACAFQESLGDLAKNGVHVLGVSRDSAAAHLRFKKKYGLDFPLLVDTDTSLHKAYGAWGLKTLYGKTSEGAIRTTVIIDAKGNVHRVFAKVKVDGHVEQVRAALPGA
jgi:peroxiredoxin Q/BCP